MIPMPVESRSTGMGSEKPVWERLHVWWLAFRWHFFSYTFLGGAGAVAVAWRDGWEVNALDMVLVLLTGAAIHYAYELANDVCDFIDARRRRAESGITTSYTGGSGLLSRGALTAGAAKRVSGLSYAAAVLLAAVIFLAGRPLGPLFVLLGGFLSWAYSAPPLRLSARGLGETAMLLAFGPVLLCGAYYVLSGSLGGEIVYLSGAVGLLTFAHMLLYELPDREEDASFAKRTLVVRLGLRRGAACFVVMLALVFVSLWGGAAVGLLPPTIALTVLPALLAVRAVRRLYASWGRFQKFQGAHLDMIKIHNGTNLSIAAAYLLDGLRAARPAWEAAAIVATITVFYAPTMLWLAKKSAEPPDSRAPVAGS